MRLDKVLLQTSVYDTLVETQNALNDKQMYKEPYDPEHGDTNISPLTASDIIEALIDGSQLIDISAITICSTLEFYDEEGDADEDDVLSKYFAINDYFYNILKNTKTRCNKYLYKKRVITYSDIITFLIIKFAHKLRKGII